MHNKMMRQNKDILKKLINGVAFLPKRAQFRDLNEVKESNNGGNYFELLSFLPEHNKDLYYSLSNNKVFTGT